MAKGRRLPSVMKSHFSTVPSTNIRRSSFDRSHGHKTTFDCDWLVPIFIDEVLPADTFSLTSTHLCRLTTLVQPLFDNMLLSIQFFYIPCRLVWSNWEDFITGSDQPVAWTGDNPANNLYVPQAHSPENGYEECSIYDYMGLPTKVKGSYKHNILPLRCYNLVYNEYFRDQNLQESLPVWMGDSDPKVDPVTGEESTASNAVPYVYKLMRRNKRYDYFTSALPGLQRGPQAGITLAGHSGRLPVHGLALSQYGAGSDVSYGGYSPLFEQNTVSLASFGTDTLNGNASTRVPSMFGVDGPFTTDPISATNGIWRMASPTVYYQGVPVDHVKSTSHQYTTPPLNAENWPIYVDLSSVASVTINSLRNAITLQHWYEAAARYGGRYTEVLNGFFNVHSGDSRLQRPEYLGGLKTYIRVTPTVQSSSTDSVSPQGNLAAYALSTDSKHLFTKSFVEHGYILGLASVTADLTYQQGLDRMWGSRFSRYDFYWPTFAHLGEQPIYNKEIYCQADSVVDSNGVSVNDNVFGFQERYGEYRYKNSRISGLLRSNATGTLDSWHLSQNFKNLPTLNSTFIESNTPIDRVLAVPDQPDILADFYFSLRCVRPMPVYSVPGLRRL